MQSSEGVPVSWKAQFGEHYRQGYMVSYVALDANDRVDPRAVYALTESGRIVRFDPARRAYTEPEMVGAHEQSRVDPPPPAYVDAQVRDGFVIKKDAPLPGAGKLVNSQDLGCVVLLTVMNDLFYSYPGSEVRPGLSPIEIFDLRQRAKPRVAVNSPVAGAQNRAWVGIEIASEGAWLPLTPHGRFPRSTNAKIQMIALDTQAGDRLFVGFGAGGDAHLFSVTTGKVIGKWLPPQGSTLDVGRAIDYGGVVPTATVRCAVGITGEGRLAEAVSAGYKQQSQVTALAALDLSRIASREVKLGFG